MITTYSMSNDASNQVNIQIYKKDWLGNQYVAIAFSDDQRMGDDLVFSCSEQGVNVGWNLRYSGPPSELEGVTILNESISAKDGHITCSFSLDEQMNFESTIVEVVDFRGDPTFDFRKDHFLFLATGPMTSQDEIGIHTVKVASEEMINVKKYQEKSKGLLIINK